MRRFGAAACLPLLLIVRPALGALVDFTTNHAPHPGVPVGFGNTSSFSGQLTGSGSSTITGVTPITGNIFGVKFRFEPNEQITPLNLVPAAVNFNTSPKSIGDADGDGNFTANKTNLEVSVPGNGSHILGAQELDVDLLNGQSVKFALNTISLGIVKYTALSNTTFENDPEILPIDIGATLKKLWTEQNGPAIFTPTGQGTGTFSIPSNIKGVLDASIALFKVPVFTLEDQSLDTTLDVTGTYNVDPITGPGSAPGPPKITLSGSTNLSLPLSLVTALATDLGIAGITGTVSLVASLNVALSYQLQGILAPEPGSIALLGIGLVGVAGLAMGRRRRTRDVARRTTRRRDL